MEKILQDMIRIILQTSLARRILRFANCNGKAHIWDKHVPPPFEKLDGLFSHQGGIYLASIELMHPIVRVTRSWLVLAWPSCIDHEKARNRIAETELNIRRTILFHIAWFSEVYRNSWLTIPRIMR